MSQDRLVIGNCPKCHDGNLVCSYNHFERDNLTIDAWEHKCPNCGFRETKAFRNDESASNPEGVDPTICPYCRRQSTTS